jgi:DNA repair protein RecO (recombination protein O)
MTITTEGIVLKKRTVNDSDLVLTLFTPDQGKLQVIVPKAKKNPNAARCDIFAIVNVVVSPGKTYWKAYEINSIDTIKQIRTSYAHFEVGSDMLSTIDSLTLIQQENLELYRILRKYLSLLDLTKPDNIDMVLLSFYQAVVNAEGLTDRQPDLQGCRDIIQGYIGADRERRKR